MTNLSLALLQGSYQVTLKGVLWGWIGAGCFLIGVVGFMVMGARATEQSRHHFVAKIFVVLTAMASYLTLALGQGAQEAHQGSAQFPYARFIDWSITTPLLLLGLAMLALPKARNFPGLVLGLMGADLYMVLTGLFAGLSSPNGNAWWVWFIVSSVAFVAIYALIWGGLASQAKEKGKQGRNLLRSRDSEERYEGAMLSGEAGLFVPMAALLSILWLVYPVNFFLSVQGIGVYGLGASNGIYTVSDVVAKVVYGFILLGGILAIERRAKKARDDSPEDYETDGEKARRDAEEARREAAWLRSRLEGAGSDSPRVRQTPRSELEAPREDGGTRSER